MRKALVVGANSGIGLSVCHEIMDKYDHMYMVGKDDFSPEGALAQKASYYKLNLVNGDFSLFDTIRDIDTLIVTVGFGRVAPFEALTEAEVKNLLNVDMTAVICIIQKYYDLIRGAEPFYTAVMGSIAGHVASPLFSIYGAAKSGLCRFIENVNGELTAAGCPNRILDVSPGALKGTAFYGGETDLTQVEDVTRELIEHMYRRDTRYIPAYDTVYKGVLDRYHADPLKFSIDSYAYKMEGGRISPKPQVVIGYLSGTFDLFHVGHLNLLRRAKACCDYLIVGVHESGAWKGKETFIPFEERCRILESVRYVDRVVRSEREDSDAWKLYGYHKLFVGSDYKGTERFARYEEFLKGKAEIIYFPYTQGTSSTQLRDALSSGKK